MDAYQSRNRQPHVADDTDEGRGEPGPRGPQGPRGAQGARGSPGPRG